MSQVFELVPEAGSSSNRRKHERLRIRTLIYAELDQDNGGIVLDASETGISVHAVVPLMGDVLPRLRLKLPDSSGWIETGARVVWTRDSGKVAGLQFEELPEPAQANIRMWLSKEASADEDEAADLGAGSAPIDKSGPVTQEAAHISEADKEPRKSLLSILPKPGVAVKNSSSFSAELSNSRSEDAESHAHDDPSPELSQRAFTPAFLPEQSRRSAAYLWLVALAIVLTASGWAVGSGRFRPTVERLRAFMQPAAPSNPVAAVENDRSSVPVNEIQILDENNHLRTISLVARATGDVPATPKPIAPASATEPNNPSGMNLQVWTLASPQSSAASRNLSATRSGAPPSVDGATHAPEISTVVPIPVDITNPDSLPKPNVVTGVLQRGVLIHRVDPVYPQIASEQHVSGTVVLQATVGADGAVRDVRVISGSKLLVQSAVGAVRHWRYSPTLLDGKPVESQVEISLVFSQPSEK